MIVGQGSGRTRRPAGKVNLVSAQGLDDDNQGSSEDVAQAGKGYAGDCRCSGNGVDVPEGSVDPGYAVRAKGQEELCENRSCKGKARVRGTQGQGVEGNARSFQDKAAYSEHEEQDEHKKVTLRHVGDAGMRGLFKTMPCNGKGKANEKQHAAHIVHKGCGRPILGKKIPGPGGLGSKPGSQACGKTKACAYDKGEEDQGEPVLNGFSFNF